MATIIDPVHLPPHIEVGALVGPLFSTSLNTLTSGNEDANSNWEEERIQVDAAYGVMRMENGADIENSFAAILSFFRARKGRYRGFLFRDYSDYQAIAQPLYAIPGEPGAYQLAKTYGSYRRRITRPEASSLKVFDGNAQLAADHVTLGELGVITFPQGAPDNPTASFDFDIPMRFDVDVLQVSLAGLSVGSIPNVNLVQVRE